MWNGKLKAVTFSYDDGVLQDKRLVQIFNKYGMKATFNLNSGMMYNECIWHTRGIDVIRMNHKECLDTLRGGHEAAVHSLTHPELTEENEYMRERQVAGDKANLEFLFKEPVYGMAYPGGTTTSPEVIDVIKNAGLKYARLGDQTESFEIPGDLYCFNSTVKHTNPNLLKIAKDFIDLKPDTPRLFYVFGHSYEFDIDKNWDVIESLCELLSKSDDIFFGTNHECLNPFYK